MRDSQAARHTSRRAASISVAMSASMKAMPWCMVIGLPNALRSVAYCEGVLVGGAGDADGLGGRRPGGWPRRWPWPAACRCAPAGFFSASRARASFSSSLSLPPSRQLPGTRTSSSTTSAVCEARMPMLLVLLALRQARACSGGTMKLAWPRPLQLGVDGGHHHVDVGDAAVGDPRLGAVEHPLVLGLVVDGLGAQRRHVGAGVGLAHAERAELHVVGRAVALGHPLHRPARGCRCR